MEKRVTAQMALFNSIIPQKNKTIIMRSNWKKSACSLAWIDQIRTENFNFSEISFGYFSFPPTSHKYRLHGVTSGLKGRVWRLNMFDRAQIVRMPNLITIRQNARVDLHIPKILIIQFHTSSVWKNACHTIFIQFWKMIEERFKLISAAVWF